MTSEWEELLKNLLLSEFYRQLDRSRVPVPAEGVEVPFNIACRVIHKRGTTALTYQVGTNTIEVKVEPRFQAPG